jgi:RNA polymerase sigma-70 factor (sigma-E family)
MDDETAFREFVTTAWSALVTTAYFVTGDRGTAEDCVQEALVRTHRRWSRIRHESPHGYVRRAVLNAALSWRRRVRAREVPFTAAHDRAGPGEAVQELPGDDLLEALLALPPRMRAVVVLRYLEDRTEAETAQLLGCSAGTVKSTAHHGLARLRGILTTGSTRPSVLGRTAR